MVETLRRPVLTIEDYFCNEPPKGLRYHGGFWDAPEIKSGWYQWWPFGHLVATSKWNEGTQFTVFLHQPGYLSSVREWAKGAEELNGANVSIVVLDKIYRYGTVSSV